MPSVMQRVCHAVTAVHQWWLTPYSKPVICAAIVPLVGLVFLNYVGPESERATAYVYTPVLPDLVAERVARASWFVSAIALALGMIAAFMLSREVIGRQVRGGRRRDWLRRTWQVTWIVTPCTLAISLIDQEWGLCSSWALTRLIESRVSARVLFHALNTVGAIPTIWIVSAASATLWHLSVNPVPAAERLRGSIRDLRCLLFAIGAVLVVAVVEIYLAHQLAALYVAPFDAPMAESTAVVIASSLGALYTMFLLAVFVPTAWQHRQAAWLIARREYPAPRKYPKRRKWLRAHDLLPQPWEPLARAAAVVSPLLAGGVVPILVEAFVK